MRADLLRLFVERPEKVEFETEVSPLMRFGRALYLTSLVICIGVMLIMAIEPLVGPLLLPRTRPAIYRFKEIRPGSPFLRELWPTRVLDASV